MFTVNTDEKSGTVTLTDLSTETSATIWPQYGGILESFSILRKGHRQNIIDCYTDFADFKQNLTSKGFKSCKLSPFACRIKDSTYSFNGATYRPDKFILGKNAIHGLLYDKHFQVTATATGERTAHVQLLYKYRGEENGYPFSYDCEVIYTLKEHNELSIHTKVTNRHSADIPIHDGWHPYFNLGSSINQLHLQLKSDLQVVCDKEIIPTGEMKPYKDYYDGKILGDQFFDDCFLLDAAAGGAPCILTDTENGLQLQVRPGKGYPYLQLYTPPHRNSIAIENLSAPPDAFNNGIQLTILQPGASADFVTSFLISTT